MPQATQLELQQIKRETEKLEWEKRVNQEERERKRREKEAKKRRRLLSKLVAPLLFVITIIITAFFQGFGDKSDATVDLPGNQRNPLEFKTALIFAVLFIAFGMATQYVLKYYGKSGLDVFALIVGVTDIDPFLLNLFQGKYDISVDVMARVTLIAVTSNNILKWVYAVFLGDKSLKKYLLSWILIILTGIGFIVFWF
jgi:uncharacterized membrane protein (DUF4010 family)